MLVELRIVSKAMELDVVATGHRMEISSLHDELEWTKTGSLR